MKLLPRIIGRGCERCRLFVWVCVWLGICVFVLQCVCRGRGRAGLMAGPLVGEQGTRGG